MNWGEIRWYTFRRPDKRRPVLLLTRNEVIEHLSEIIVVPATRTIRGLTFEVVLTVEDGMPAGSLSPRLVLARWTHRIFYGQETPERVAYHKSQAMNGDLTRIEDIVPIVRFLATDGWWITGQTIFANGGYTTR